MKRGIIFGLILMYCSSLLAAVAPGQTLLDADTVSALQDAGVTDEQISDIESSIASDTELTYDELLEAMEQAGVTPEQLEAISAAADATVAIAGAAGSTVAWSSLAVIGASIGVAILVTAAAVAAEKSISNSKSPTGSVI